MKNKFFYCGLIVIFAFFSFFLEAMEKNSERRLQESYNHSLLSATQREDSDDVKYWLKSGADPQAACAREFPFNAFSCAVNQGNVSIVQEFIERGSPIDQKFYFNVGSERIVESALVHAQKQDHGRLVYLLSLYQQLFNCVTGNKPHDLEVLLTEHKIYIDARRYDYKTPLQVACFYGHFAVLKILLESKASVHISDKFGKTALYHALTFPNCFTEEKKLIKEENCLKIIVYLLNYGAELTGTLNEVKLSNNIKAMVTLKNAIQLYFENNALEMKKESA